ncbi:BatD family protein [Azorhizobium doebereinerae]|uniref:BatD family protein n=1 Tax=Azorhizobium doebereinerae TaxID=281091 RepID=UPI0004069AC8|nr:BatD family protein [Azorhizobium doebereinerae]
MTAASRAMRSLPGLLLLFALVLAPGLALAAARLSATVSPGTIIAGDTVQMVLTLTDGDGKEPPNLTALTRDFDIIEQGRRSRSLTVDGRKVPVNEWLITLAPRRSGKLTIPALSVAGQVSAPLTLTVVPAANTAELEDRPLFVRLDAGDVAPFVQSDVPVTIRVYDRLGIRAGGISRIAAEGATFTPQGEQRAYFRTVGRNRYQVIEQSYLMRPQRSGTIDIPPVTLEAKVPGYNGGALPSEMAQMLGRNPNASPWLSGQPDYTRDVTVKSNPLAIKVRERPADAKGWFLPARSVTLSSDWSTPLKGAKVGEVLTRTIRLEAQGAGPNQLPPVTLPEVPGVRQYEETSRADSAPVRGEAGALLTKTVSVVPTRPGPVTLPAIEVAWWNTATQTQETAVLPAESFTVAPNPRAAEPAAPPTAATGASSAAVPPPAETPRPDALSEAWTRATALLLRHRETLAGVLGFIAAVFVLSAIGRRLAPRLKRKGRSDPTRAGMPGPLEAPLPARSARPPRDPAQAEQALIAACKANDAGAAHRAVLAWLRLVAVREEPAAPRSAELEQALGQLRERLYGATPARFDGAGFLKAFRAEQKARARREKTPRGARLAPLYPTAS